MWPLLQFYYSGYIGKLTLKPRVIGTVKDGESVDFSLPSRGYPVGIA
jgi:hypothetical protein